MIKKLRLLYWPLILAPLVLFGPAVFTGKALYWGTPSLQFIPWWDWAWEMIRAGRIPLWNPLVGMGAPLVANYQSAIFYPPHWIYFLLDTLGGVTWMAWGTSVLVVLHLAWAGIGLAVLLDRLGLSRTGQIVGGLSFSLSGYLVARAGFLSITAAAAWIPWIMAGVLILTRARNLISALILGTAFGMQFLAGHAQTAWYTILLASAWWLFWSLRESRWPRTIQGATAFLRDAGWMAFSGVLGVMLSALQLLPTLQYLLVSQRAEEFGYQQAATYSFWPWRFLSLMAPDLFGNPARGNFWGYGSYWEDAVYFGFLPLVLALITVISSFQKKRDQDHGGLEGILENERGLIWFLCGVIAVSFVLSLGKNTPVFPFFYRWIPTFDLFQAPARMTIWAVFSFSILAAIGMDHLRPPSGRRLYWNRLAVAGSAALAIGAGLTWLIVQDVEVTLIRAGAEMGLWAVGTSLILLLVPETKQSLDFRIWKWAAVGLVALDLIYTGWGLNPSVEAKFYQEQTGKNYLKERLYLDPGDEYRLKFDVFFRFEDYRAGSGLQDLRESYLPNLNMLDGLASATNFDPLVPARYQTWMEALQKADWKVKQNMLDQMDVQTLVIPDAEGKAALVPRKGKKPQKVRYFSCPRYIESSDEILQILIDDKIDPDREVLIEGQSPGEQWSGCLESEAKFEITHEAPGRLEMQVSADHPGWVVWSQVLYPGWRGEVDGERRQVQRANYLFQALPLREGVHTVEFQYQSRSFQVGALISLLVCLAAAGSLLVERRKRINQD